MAIDTAEKRRAAAHVSRVWCGKGVTPTVGKDAEWRQQVAWSYSGIAASAPAVGGGGGNMMMMGIGSIAWLLITLRIVEIIKKY